MYLFWRLIITETKSHSLNDKAILEKWVSSKVVVSTILVDLIVNELIAHSIEWDTSVDPGLELIVYNILISDM